MSKGHKKGRCRTSRLKTRLAQYVLRSVLEIPKNSYLHTRYMGLDSACSSTIEMFFHALYSGVELQANILLLILCPWMFMLHPTCFSIYFEMHKLVLGFFALLSHLSDGWSMAFNPDLDIVIVSE